MKQRVFLLFAIVFCFIFVGCGSGEGAATEASTAVATVETSTPEATATQKPTDAPPTNTPMATATLKPTEVPPTNTPMATATQKPTQPPQPTAVPTQPPAPTSPPEPTAPPAPSSSQVIITAVNKGDEYVDIQNTGASDISLDGWVLVSERGNQTCGLNGVLPAGVTLRIYALAEDSGLGGFNCGFGGPIWNNGKSDPAVLYDNTGTLVARR